MPTQHRARGLRDLGGVVAPLAIVATVVWVQAWHGPTLLTLSSTHGVDTGDLIAVPFLLLAIAVARRRRARPVSPEWAVAAAAAGLGALLLLAGVISSEGGPLVPAGGATLDGTIDQTMAADAIEVGRWTDIAMTYDGSTERLYVDGREVSREPAAGRIQAARTPLWIGSNVPYREHFAGLIDDVRTYDRVLSPAEIRRDMERPVRPAPGLVAAYGFDAGKGKVVADGSGRRNTGTIEGGTTWTRGRHGSALRFDGSTSVVRVPPSPSLDLGRAMTLSAWVRPTEEQTGWRAVVQKEVDAYFLSAGSGSVNHQGALDALRIAAVVAAIGWFLLLVATGSAPRSELRRRTWWLPVVLFAAGALADAASAPSVTLVAPLLVALWLAATADGRLERACLWAAAAVLAGLTLAVYADVDRVVQTLAHLRGGSARSVALGVLFVIAGVAARPAGAHARLAAG
jgi:hypothetical protein